MGRREADASPGAWKVGIKMAKKNAEVSGEVPRIYLGLLADMHAETLGKPELGKKAFFQAFGLDSTSSRTFVEFDADAKKFFLPEPAAIRNPALADAVKQSAWASDAQITETRALFEQYQAAHPSNTMSKPGLAADDRIYLHVPQCEVKDGAVVEENGVPKKAPNLGDQLRSALANVARVNGQDLNTMIGGVAEFVKHKFNPATGELGQWAISQTAAKDSPFLQSLVTKYSGPEAMEAERLSNAAVKATKEVVKDAARTAGRGDVRQSPEEKAMFGERTVGYIRVTDYSVIGRNKASLIQSFDKLRTAADFRAAAVGIQGVIKSLDDRIEAKQAIVAQRVKPLYDAAIARGDVHQLPDGTKIGVLTDPTDKAAEQLALRENRLLGEKLSFKDMGNPEKYSLPNLKKGALEVLEGLQQRFEKAAFRDGENKPISFDTLTNWKADGREQGKAATQENKANDIAAAFSKQKAAAVL